MSILVLCLWNRCKMSDVSSLGILKSFETMPGLDSRLVVWTFLVLCLFVWISSTKKIATGKLKPLTCYDWFPFVCGSELLITLTGNGGDDWQAKVQKQILSTLGNLTVNRLLNVFLSFPVGKMRKLLFNQFNRGIMGSSGDT